MSGNKKRSEDKLATITLIGKYKARKYGPRGVQVIIPAVYLRKAGIKPKDLLEFYQDEMNPKRLIMEPAGD